jgi:serine protease Do
MVEQKLLEVIERYINGEMSGDELARFQLLMAENKEVNDRVNEHREFTNLIKQYGERLELEKRLDAIHSEIDIHTLKDEMMVHPAWIVKLWRHHHSKISVAASIAIFAVLFTLFFTGYLTNRESNYVKLKGEVDQLKLAVNGPRRAKLPRPAKINNPGKFRGTGFAISSNGYIVTDYHLVNNADSVYVENADGKSFKTKTIWLDPQTDVAILEITDTSFTKLGALPYNIKKSESDIGESVYSLGYPRDARVLGVGYLTASNGFKSDKSSDSTTYQVSIPVNQGDSGGPVIDSKGNVIGIVSAKETHVEGAHFAIKSNYLLKALHDIPEDSLKRPLKLNSNSKNTLASLNKVEQVKKLQNFVFMVKVYNQ